ncbi:MAG: GyrI-like domain-containing protein [Flavisolibacter sp.]|nr:GyrI-like domain-containing protein [Flavisolibacter sp.]
MKKWIISVFLFLLLLLAAVFVWIPDQLQIIKKIKVNATQTSVSRVLENKANWTRWWPGTSDVSRSKEEQFIYRNVIYTIVNNRFNGVDLLLNNGERNIRSSLSLLPLLHDSIEVVWQSTITTGLNPLQKIAVYGTAKKLEKDIDSILYHLQLFLNKNENIYGSHIQQIIVKDTILIATRMTTSAYPSTREIYGLIEKLHQYIAQQGATEQNYPMLHVQRKDSSRYETMVAIPVNKGLPERPNLYQKRMVPGYILVTEVKGGPATIKAAFDQLENYISDYNKSSPAIPFESLVTNRMNEPDTTKWITRIYYPVY